VFGLSATFSEAAIWLVYGLEGTWGLQKYRERRIKETERAVSSENSGCFHDGENVLKFVTAAHQMLLHDLHKSDTITEAVVEMIYHMLAPEVSRVLSSALWTMVKHKLQKEKPTHPQKKIYSVRNQPTLVLETPIAFDESPAHLEGKPQERTTHSDDTLVDNSSHGFLVPPATEGSRVDPPMLSVSDAWMWRNSNPGGKVLPRSYQRTPAWIFAW
jgi:hypothetical protein